jgi:hypothetical protein
MIEDIVCLLSTELRLNSDRNDIVEGFNLRYFTLVFQTQELHAFIRILELKRLSCNDKIGGFGRKIAIREKPPVSIILIPNKGSGWR